MGSSGDAANTLDAKEQERLLQLQIKKFNSYRPGTATQKLEQILSRVEIPADLLKKIGPEMKMDCHWVDVRLMDGHVVTNLVVRGGRFITGHSSALNGEGELSFSAVDMLICSEI